MTQPRRFQCCAACNADDAPSCSRRCLCHSRDSGQPAFVYFPVIGEQYAAAERFARGERVAADGFAFEAGAVILRYPGGAEERHPCEVKPIGDRSWLVIVTPPGADATGARLAPTPYIDPLTGIHRTGAWLDVTATTHGLQQRAGEGDDALAARCAEVDRIDAGRWPNAVAMRVNGETVMVEVEPSR